MDHDPNNPRGIAPSPDGIIRDRKWWLAILVVSDLIASRYPSMQTTEAVCVNGIWWSYPNLPKIK